MLEATLVLATIVRDVEIASACDRFPITMSLNVVAAEPFRAPVSLRARSAGYTRLRSRSAASASLTTATAMLWL